MNTGANRFGLGAVGGPTSYTMPTQAQARPALQNIQPAPRPMPAPMPAPQAQPAPVPQPAPAPQQNRLGGLGSIFEMIFKGLGGGNKGFSNLYNTGRFNPNGSQTSPFGNIARTMFGGRG